MKNVFKNVTPFFTLTLTAAVLSVSVQAMGATNGVDCEARVVNKDQIEAADVLEATLGNEPPIYYKTYGTGAKMVGSYKVTVKYENSGKTTIDVYRKLNVLEKISYELDPGGGGDIRFHYVETDMKVLNKENNFMILTADDKENGKIVQVKCTLRTQK